MSRKARLFLIMAFISLVVTMLRYVDSIAVPANVCDFAAGFGAAMFFGALVTWSGKRN
jgi:hypothetical protein